MPTTIIALTLALHRDGGMVMDKFRRLGALLGVAAVAVALVGVTLLLGEPAAAEPQDCAKDQGLMTSNLGI